MAYGCVRKRGLSFAGEKSPAVMKGFKGFNGFKNMGLCITHMQTMVLVSLAISGTDSVEVPTIYKAYF